MSGVNDHLSFCIYQHHHHHRYAQNDRDNKTLTYRLAVVCKLLLICYHHLTNSIELYRTDDDFLLSHK